MGKLCQKKLLELFDSTLTNEEKLLFNDTLLIPNEFLALNYIMEIRAKRKALDFISEEGLMEKFCKTFK